jgi:hypothetical protein
MLSKMVGAASSYGSAPEHILKSQFIPYNGPYNGTSHRSHYQSRVLSYIRDGGDLAGLAFGQAAGTEHAALEVWRAIDCSLDHMGKTYMPEQCTRDIIKHLEDSDASLAIQCSVLFMAPPVKFMALPIHLLINPKGRLKDYAKVAIKTLHHILHMRQERLREQRVTAERLRAVRLHDDPSG